MNMNQIINMVMRLFLRKAISKGIDKGFNMAATRKKGPAPDPEAERLEKSQGQENAKRAKQAMRVGRRIGRM